MGDAMPADLARRLRVRRIHDHVLATLGEVNVREHVCPGCGVLYPYPDYFTCGCCGYCGEVWELPAPNEGEVQP
jgi:ribosomal protein S27AE